MSSIETRRGFFRAGLGAALAAGTAVLAHWKAARTPRIGPALDYSPTSPSSLSLSGAGAGEPASSLFAQVEGELDTTDASPTQIGVSFDIPSDSLVTVDVQIACIEAGAARAKVFNARRHFINVGGAVSSTGQFDTLGPEEIGGSLDVSVGIENDGASGRYVVTGKADTLLRWRLDSQTVRVTAAPLGGPSSQFDMATVPWSLWVDGDGYDPATGWVAGKPSAGSSASHPLQHIYKPPAGPAVNGHATLALDGVRDYLRYALGAGAADLLATDGWTVSIVASLSNISTDDATNPFCNAALGLSADANWTIALRSSGPTVQAYHYADGYRIASTSVPMNQLVLIQAKFDGQENVIKLRIGKSSWVATSASNVMSIGGPFFVGRSYYGKLVQGVIAEYAVAKAAVDDLTLNRVADAMAQKWGIAV